MSRLTALSARSSTELVDQAHRRLLSLGNAAVARLGPLVDQAVRLLIDSLPRIESLGIEMVESLLQPKLVIKQILALTALRGGLIFIHGLKRAGVSLFSRLTLKGRQRRDAKRKMQNATSYSEWRRCAQDYDKINGHMAWRNDENSPCYDGVTLKRHIKVIESMMERKDIFSLMFRIRGGLARHQHGLLHENLFSVAQSGTKKIVEKYHQTISKALEVIATSTDDGIPTEVKLNFFNEARHAYGRTALMLSGGAILGFYHTGVVKALLEAGVFPRVISGASAGAIFTAVVGTHTDDELLHMMNTGDRFRMDFIIQKKQDATVFLGQRWSGWKRLSQMLRMINPMPWKMDTEHLKEVIRNNCGEYTFMEAFEYTGRIINITVAPANKYDPPRLLNYITAPHVLVWSAALASSCIPGVFEPQCLQVKESNGTIRAESATGRTFTDGSVECDLPMSQLSELFNINHFIVSQVNPHATLFSSFGLGSGGMAMSDTTSLSASPALGFVAGLVGFLQAQLRAWAVNMLRLVTVRHGASEWAMKRGFVSALMQEYEGRPGHDISLLPWAGDLNPITSLGRFLINPQNMTEFDHIRVVSERNTWPKLAQTHAHCDVEVTLERCVQRTRHKLKREADAEKLHHINSVQQLSSLHDSNGSMNNGSDGTLLPPVRGGGSGMSSGYSFVNLDKQLSENSLDNHQGASLQGGSPTRSASPGGIRATSREVVSLSGLAITDTFENRSLAIEKSLSVEETLGRSPSSTSENGGFSGSRGMSSGSLNRSDGGDGEGGGSGGGGGGMGVIKSTSMANFYYQHGQQKSSNSTNSLPTYSNQYDDPQQDQDHDDKTNYF
eukprot:CAMPEP_0119487064 /NCGR_PEP_ID=MMETSP1344-20130328/13249_1 /TAXON_ID=236787 /ORGANISM="Florenciella parvula, Strain CCMP2471" /LENGTH=839 /DNA_ID=CAMNT_0007521875 /DNA_START=134 /DNA_END=2653 /DNA_ORIENTATION=+